MSNTLKLRLFICGVVLLIAGIACASASLAEKREIAKGMKDFNEMYESDFYKGQYVQGELLELWDEFAYMEEYTETMGIKGKSRVSAHYYVMPLQTSYETGSPVFAAVCLRNLSQISQAEQMINEMNDYWDEESDGLYTSIPITGKVSVLDDELKQYFYEWLMYGDEESSTSEYEQYVCPYLITAVQPDSSNSALSMGALMAVIGAVLVAAVIIVTVKSRKDNVTADETVQAGVQYPEQDSTLMNDMAKLHQPEDNADEFFNRPIKPHETSDSDNGLGIGIDDK
ncbi:MAG: hypothetical protein L6V87_08730 [Ruminococcus sp.]|nr:MAG: hypothetical protein L6V87_08730 [Ruminococcus sp.]